METTESQVFDYKIYFEDQNRVLLYTRMYAGNDIEEARLYAANLLRKDTQGAFTFNIEEL
jgi:hypothetical protein